MQAGRSGSMVMLTTLKIPTSAATDPLSSFFCLQFFLRQVQLTKLTKPDGEGWNSVARGVGNVSTKAEGHCQLIVNLQFPYLQNQTTFLVEVGQCVNKTSTISEHPYLTLNNRKVCQMLRIRKICQLWYQIQFQSHYEWQL